MTRLPLAALLVAVVAADPLPPEFMQAIAAGAHDGSPLRPAGDSVAPKVRLMSPVDGGFVTGPTVLRAEVEPSSAAARASFFVDGTEVCRRTNAPFECEWDAGAVIVAHQVRLVVSLTSGGRIVRTVRTANVSFAETVEVNVVQVTATVTDSRGRYVDGLPRSAFRVFEDGTPQAISHFYAEDAPLELVVALDVSTSMAPALAEMKRAVSAFLRTLPARHRLTLLGFNDEVFTLLPRTASAAERDQVINALSAWGTTALYEGIIRSVEMLGSRPGRKAALVFTDGQDLGSRVTVAEVERTLHASDSILYMIGQGQSAEQAALKKVMDRLALPTGGRTISTTSISALERAFADLFEEMSHQYVLGYQAPGGVRDDRWREIRVTVDGDYRVRGRQGYRASRIGS